MTNNGFVDAYKPPLEENDSYLVRLSRFPVCEVNAIEEECGRTMAAYVAVKSRMFETLNVDPRSLIAFVDSRPSLRGLGNMLEASAKLDTTNYSVACGRENGLSKDELLTNVRDVLERSSGCRRCVVRLANPGKRYLESVEDKTIDVACTLAIHFMVDRVVVYMRASDIANELIPDLVLLTKHFLHPVYGHRSVPIEIYSGTAQNISSWDRIMVSLSNLVGSVSQ